MPNLIDNTVMAISSEQFYGNSSEISAEKDNASPKQNKFLQNSQRKAGTPQPPTSASSERKIKPEFKAKNNIYRSQTSTYSSYSGGKRTNSPSSSYSFKSKPTKERKVFDSLPRKPPLSDDNNRNYSLNRRTVSFLPKFSKPRIASQGASSSQKENNSKSMEKASFNNENGDTDSLTLSSIDENSNHDRIPQGLHNYGNTCYVNSVLQTVFSLNFFMDKLADIVHKQQDQREFDDEELKKLPLVFKFIELYREFTSLHPSKSTLNDSVLTIKNCIAEHVNTTFASARQQCAAEFLTVILEELKNEFDFLTGKRIPNLVDKTFQYTLIQRRFCPNCDKTVSENSYVSSTFYLALTDNRNVQSSFLHFLNDEEPNVSKCPDCDSKLICTKLFNDVPKVLFFQVLRYSNEFMKDTMAFDASAFIYLPKKFFKNQELFLSPLATPFRKGLRNIQPLYSNLKKDCIKKLTFEEGEQLSNLPMVSEDGHFIEDDLVAINSNNNNNNQSENIDSSLENALVGGDINVHDSNNNHNCDETNEAVAGINDQTPPLDSSILTVQTQSSSLEHYGNVDSTTATGNGSMEVEHNNSGDSGGRSLLLNGSINSVDIFEPNLAEEADCPLSEPMTPDYDKAGPSRSPTEPFGRDFSTPSGVLTPDPECEPAAFDAMEPALPAPVPSSSSSSMVTPVKAEFSESSPISPAGLSPESSPSHSNDRSGGGIGDSERYQLVSIISHHGSQMSFGHYTASVFNSARSSWFYCDDNNIHPVPFDHVRQSCSRTGCCYLYVHCDP